MTVSRKSSYPLQKLRKKLNISQDALANLCGTTRDRISMWERAHFPPSLEYQIKLSQALKSPLIDLQRLCKWPETPHVYIRGLENQNNIINIVSAEIEARRALLFKFGSKPDLEEINPHIADMVELEVLEEELEYYINHLAEVEENQKTESGAIK